MSSVEGGVSLIKDGLILCLDAANPKSYFSGNTYWYDLSTYNKTATMVNPPTYTTQNKGGLVFDGVNDYITLGTDQDFYFNLTKPYTISVWLKVNTLKTCGLVTRYNAGVSGNYFLKLLYTGNIMFNREISPFNLFSSQTLLVNKPYNVIIQYDGTYQKIYINGVFDNQRASGNIVANQSNINLFIGCSQTGYNPYEFFDGTMYNVDIYNRALSSTEILKNYNNFKSRYGL